MKIASSSGPRLTLEMDVSRNLRRPDRTYAPYFRFADGTVALLSNDFRLQATGFRNSCVRFVAAKGTRILGDDEVSSRSIQLDSQWSGYVALGNPLHYTSDHASFVQDRLLPPWIGTSIREAVRRISRLYSSELGDRRLPEIFIFSAAPAHTGPAASGYHGDVLQDSISLDFYGNDWRHRQPSRVAQPVGLLAHELFHVWDSNPEYPSPGNLLVMEGGAQVARALAESRLHPRQSSVLGTLSRALNSCVDELNPGQSLGSRLRSGPGPLPYDCGPPFVLAAVTAGRRSRTVERAFFTAWKSALDRAGRRGYDWRGLIAGNAPPPVVRDLSDAISVPGGYERNLRKALVAGGYDLAPDPDLSRQERMTAAARLMGEIMASNCHGQVSFYTKFPQGFLIAPLPGPGACASLTPHETIARIENESPWSSPISLSAKVAGICASRGEVRVSLEGQAGTKKVMCSDDVHAIPEPVTLRPDPRRRVH